MDLNSMTPEDFVKKASELEDKVLEFNLMLKDGYAPSEISLEAYVIALCDQCQNRKPNSECEYTSVFEWLRRPGKPPLTCAQVHRICLHYMH